MSAGPSLGMESLPSTANVGKNVVVKGHLLSGEDLTIFGEVEGTIDIVEHRLTIAADGSVRADVKAHGRTTWVSFVDSFPQRRAGAIKESLLLNNGDTKMLNGELGHFRAYGTGE